MKISVMKSILTDKSQVFSVLLMDGEGEVEIHCLSEKHANTLMNMLTREIERATGFEVNDW